MMRQLTILSIAFFIGLSVAVLSGQTGVLSDQTAIASAPLTVGLMFGEQVQQPPQPPVEVQPPPDLDIDIEIDEAEAWYANPVWLAIGGIVLLIVILAIAFGSRGGTTVVRG